MVFIKYPMRSFLIFTTSFLIFSSSSAMSNLHSPYVFVQTGISLSTVGQTQELKLLGQLGSTYVANRNLNTQPFMYFGVGNVYQLNSQLRWNSNFAYMFIGNGTTSGSLTIQYLTG